jgi:hypothetical protein
VIKPTLLVLAISLAACGGDDGAGGPDATPASCTDYCNEIMTNCSGAEAQYTSMDICLSACAAMPQGSAGDQTGNSLECRNYHAGAALGDPTTHCVHAGPGGAGVCGANCDGFCQIVQASCTGADEAYASDVACIEACMDFADTEKFDVTDVSGDTLACRLYHASVATADPDTHCAHTQPVSAVCN